MVFVRQLSIKPGMSVDELVRGMEGCGFGARRLAQAAEIYEEMIKGDYRKFLTLAGAMVPAGMRDLISELIRSRMIDVLITTGANIVHDIVESFSHHRLGYSDVDDYELRSEGIARIYDVYISDEDFVRFEELVQRILPDGEDRISGRELLRDIGSKINDERSILRSASDSGVPVFCPAITDSMLGLQAWLHRQTKRLNLDVLEDVREIVDICYESERAGIVIVGGGVPKNFALQSMLVTPNSFRLAIQLTTDHPEAGGLSGATLSEAISWGKIAHDARYVTVYGDATITLPLLAAAVISRVQRS